MSITLLCLVKGNTLANAFPVDINKDQLVGHLKKVIKAEKQNDFAGVDADKLKLWKVPISDNHVDPLSNLSLEDSKELLAIRKISNTVLTHFLKNIFILSLSIRDHRHFEL